MDSFEGFSCMAFLKCIKWTLAMDSTISIDNGIIRLYRSTMQMRPIVTVRVAWSVCVSVCCDREPCNNGWTVLNDFGLWIWVGPRNLHIRWVPDPHWKRRFRREGVAHCKVEVIPSTCGSNAAFLSITSTTCSYYDYSGWRTLEMASATLVRTAGRTEWMSNFCSSNV